MNQEVKKKWVDALRSGEYKQAKFGLNISGEYCCLGVLCDLHAKETGNTWADCNNKTKDAKVLRLYLNENAVLPDAVCKWAGLPTGGVTTRSVVLPEDKLVRGTLAGLNDQSFTFEQIADEIEKQL